MKSERPTKARFLPHEEISSPLPILCEPLSLLELAELQLSPVYYGMGVPAGDGSAVVIIPGLLLRVKYDTGRLGQWARQLELRAPRNKVVVAVANKLARIAWAVLSTGNEYRNAAIIAA